MTSRPASQCGFCRHYVSVLDRPPGSSGPACSAFPDGIPEELLRNRADHRQPFPDDHGVRWEPDGDVEFPDYAFE